jgi:hypothetical protein
VEMNPAVVDEVQRLLGQIRGGWQGVMARHA